MNRRLLFAGLAVLVLGLAAWFVLKKNSQSATFNPQEVNFSVKDTAGIDKIFIAQKAGRQTLLTRLDNGWRVNNKYWVDPVQIGHILQAVHDVKVKRPVSKGERERVLASISGKHAKVEIYRKGELVKTYYVGAETNDALGTYYLMEGSENPYVAYLPGWDGVLNVRFNFAEKEFRDRGIFRSMAGTLKEAKVEFPGKPDSSVVLRGKGSYYYIEGVTVPDTARLIAFVKMFERVHFQDYRSNWSAEHRDSVLKFWQPLAVVTVTDSVSEKSEKLSLYVDYREAEYGTGYLHSTGDWVAIYMPAMNQLLRNRNYFVSRKQRLGLK